MRVDYLRLAGGTQLLSTATVVKLGRTIAVSDVRIVDDQQRLVAIGRAAYVTAERVRRTHDRQTAADDGLRAL